MKIGFNKPYTTGKEIDYIKEAIASSKISGDGSFTKKCNQFFEQRFQFKKALLTTSCTDALEMAAILTNIQAGDEVIIPSYTFVSTANAFVLRGAKIVFVDSRKDHPGMDELKLEGLITSRTKAIVVVHYAGVAVDMDLVMQIAARHNLFVIEDAAQAIDAYYKGKPLGGIGHLAAFSFHETKNIQCGEGGLLAINDKQFSSRAEIIREKGTNRSAFFRGEVDKYGWVDMGSSFLPSDMLAAFLFAQLEELENIQSTRLNHWQAYYELLQPLEEMGFLKLPFIPEYATNNAHMFYVLTKNLEERTALIEYLQAQEINSVFHYQSLHKSKFYLQQSENKELEMTDFYTNSLLRLPMFYELTQPQIEQVTNAIISFYA
jgi:dTDP-4-amino-4,6-dideoxygalactose transaminase